MAKTAAKGGSAVKRLCAEWTSGRYSTWSFKIFYSELEPEKLMQENVRLNAEKRKLEDYIDVLTCKKVKIEGKLKEALAKTQGNSYKQKFKVLTQKLIRQQRRQNTSRGPSKSKTFLEYSKRQQSRIRKQMVGDCEMSLTFLGLHNFVATEVEVFTENNQKY